jgi:hypothetical protein
MRNGYPLVDDAVTAGKVAPANRDMYLALCRSEEGRQQFAAFVKTAQPLVNQDPSKGKENKGQQTTLTETELAMCRSMGLTRKSFSPLNRNRSNNNAATVSRNPARAHHLPERSFH